MTDDAKVLADILRIEPCLQRLLEIAKSLSRSTNEIVRHSPFKALFTQFVGWGRRRECTMSHLARLRFEASPLGALSLGELEAPPTEQEVAQIQLDEELMSSCEAYDAFYAAILDATLPPRKRASRPKKEKRP